VNTDRYRPYADRPDLVRCVDCSTRSTVALVMVDELADHEETHNG